MGGRGGVSAVVMSQLLLLSLFCLWCPLRCGCLCPGALLHGSSGAGHQRVGAAMDSHGRGARSHWPVAAHRGPRGTSTEGQNRRRRVHLGPLHEPRRQGVHLCTFPLGVSTQLRDALEQDRDVGSAVPRLECAVRHSSHRTFSCFPFIWAAATFCCLVFLKCSMHARTSTCVSLMASTRARHALTRCPRRRSSPACSARVSPRRWRLLSTARGCGCQGCSRSWLTVDFATVSASMSGTTGACSREM